jgi:hypothetical protein
LKISHSYLMEKELECCFAFLSIVMKTGMLHWQREKERERRHAALGSGQGWPLGRGGKKGEERSEDEPPEKKKAGPRGKREPGRAAEKRRGKATRFRKEREGGWLLLFLPFLFLFPDFPNLTQFNLNPNGI